MVDGPQRGIGTNKARLALVLDELQSLILQRYPAANFDTTLAEDEPGTMHLHVTVDVEDTDEVLDLVIDRVLELQVHDRLPVHVLPVRPLVRVAVPLRSRRDSGPTLPE